MYSDKVFRSISRLVHGIINDICDLGTRYEEGWTVSSQGVNSHVSAQVVIRSYTNIKENASG